MAKISHIEEINTNSSNRFKGSFYSYFSYPDNLLIEHLPTDKITQHTLEIFNLLGYFMPNKLWQDMHLFGIKKGSSDPFFSHPDLVFAKLYQACLKAGAYDKNEKLNTDIFLANAFGSNNTFVTNLFDHHNIINKNSHFADLSSSEINNAIFKHLILYWFQNAFNRPQGAEYISLLLSEEQTNQNQQTSKFLELNEHFQELGFIKSINPQTLDPNYTLISGSSFEGMMLTYTNAVNNILPNLFSSNNLLDTEIILQGGDRKMNLVDGSILSPANERVDYARQAIKTVAGYKNIKLNEAEPFIEKLNGTKLVNLTPNYLYDADANPGLTEADIARYLAYDKFKDTFSSFKVTILDTQNEPGQNRPTTYTTATHSFLKIIGDLLVNKDDSNQDFASDYKIVLITVGAPFIQRQGLNELRAMNDTFDKLIKIFKTNNFNTLKELGEAIVKSLEYTLPPSEILKKIESLAECTDAPLTPDKSELAFKLEHLKQQFFIEPVGAGIEGLAYEHAIQMIISEFGSKAFEEFLSQSETLIPVEFQSRQNDTNIVPPYPTPEELGYLFNQLKVFEELSMFGVDMNE